MPFPSECVFPPSFFDINTTAPPCALPYHAMSLTITFVPVFTARKKKKKSPNSLLFFVSKLLLLLLLSHFSRVGFRATP